MIEAIREKFTAGEREYSQHASDRMLQRGISRQEVDEAVIGGEIIEEYPNDKYGPSCLIFGRTAAGRPLHVQATDASRARVKVITAYEPDAAEWDDFRVRRSP